MNKAQNHLIFLTSFLLSGCNVISPQPVSDIVEDCTLRPPSEPILREVKDINLIPSLEKIGEGRINSTETVGYRFQGKSGQQLQLELEPEDICIWILDPNSEVFEKNTLTEDGIYLVQLAAPKGKQVNYSLSMGLANGKSSPSPTPTPSPSPTSNISLIGTWEGSYALNTSKTSTLNITEQDGNSFEGTLDTFGKKGNKFTLDIEGTFELSSREISFREVDVFKHSGGTWYLGENKGSLSVDFNEMYGKGDDEDEKPNKPNEYNWFFKKVN